MSAATQTSGDSAPVIIFAMGPPPNTSTEQKNFSDGAAADIDISQNTGA